MKTQTIVDVDNLFGFQFHRTQTNIDNHLIVLDKGNKKVLIRKKYDEYLNSKLQQNGEDKTQQIIKHNDFGDFFSVYLYDHNQNKQFNFSQDMNAKIVNSWRSNFDEFFIQKGVDVLRKDPKTERIFLEKKVVLENLQSEVRTYKVLYNLLDMNFNKKGPFGQQNFTESQKKLAYKILGLLESGNPKWSIFVEPYQFHAQNRRGDNFYIFYFVLKKKKLDSMANTVYINRAYTVSFKFIEPRKLFHLVNIDMFCELDNTNNINTGKMLNIIPPRFIEVNKQLWSEPDKQVKYFGVFELGSDMKFTKWSSRIVQQNVNRSEQIRQENVEGIEKYANFTKMVYFKKFDCFMRFNNNLICDKTTSTIENSLQIKFYESSKEV